MPLQTRRPPAPDTLSSTVPQEAPPLRSVYLLSEMPARRCGTMSLAPSAGIRLQYQSRTHTGLTANPVTNTWSSLFRVPNAFNTVGRLIVSTFGAGVARLIFVVAATYTFPNESP